MTTLDDVRMLAAADRGLAVVSTVRPDGTVHSSLVNAGVMAHPVSGHDTVAFVVFGKSVKLRLLRQSRRAVAVFRSDWRWAGVEGGADIIGPDDAFPGFPSDALPQLMRDVFTAAGGTHDDWDEYDRVIAAERRAAILVHPERITGAP